MTAIERVIEIAMGEVGYLEKKSSSQLYDKTANAGSANYTKYWAEIKPEYQCQPWCACFVTWLFVKAFGTETAAQLLKHYPFIYVPNIVSKFGNNVYTNPKVGDIVAFWNGGTYSHTGYVISVNGGTFTTIEGNTSGGSSIIANGGGVCKKTYLLSAMTGTRFCRPDYGIIKEEAEELTMTRYEELKEEITALKKESERKNTVITAVGEDLQKIFAVLNEISGENDRQNDIINMVGADIAELKKARQ